MPEYTSLLTKHRPTCFEEVIGQEAVVRSLFNALKTRSSHAFLFVGPSGTGKTTLARLAAKQLGCKDMDLLEIDCASNTGIDEMRKVASDLLYRPLGEGSIKAVICDEAHSLSKAAITSLLKVVEDPPEHVYWFFCTTEASKVPAALKTRCVSYELKSVPISILGDFLEEIIEAEKLKVTGDIVDLCAKEARGSPRQALANLALCAIAKNKAEAAELLSTAEGSETAFALAQALYKGASWSELQKLIGKLGEVNPESVRHVVRAYGTKVALGAQKDDVAQSALAVLDAFSVPFNSSDGLTPLVLACGRLTLQ